jgi:Transposase IS116/IS110/IS902 family
MTLREIRSNCGSLRFQTPKARLQSSSKLLALAYVLIIGTPARFQCGKQIGTYAGMIPCEDSSARKQRLGHISKQGSSLLCGCASCWWKRPKRQHVSIPTETPVHSPGDASAQKHRQGSDGAPASSSVVLDVAEWL